jgi:hypothetical protein
MIEHHSFSVATEQLPSLLHSFRRPLDEQDATCPLCLKFPKAIESNLARHHSQLALFAIPRLHYRDHESENGSKRGASRRSESQLSRRSNSQGASTIENPTADVEREVLEEPSTNLTVILQELVPGDDDFDCKLPPNPGGIEYWLHLRSTTELQEPNLHDKGNFQIFSWLMRLWISATVSTLFSKMF